MKTTPQLLARARSFLFVPADRPERLPKALASSAHAVIADLEDAVAPEDKSTARQSLASGWSALSDVQRERMVVRINAAGTPWHDDDLALLRELRPAGVMLSKSESVAAVARVAKQARAPVLPLIESAQGLHALDLIASTPGVLRLVFGHLDFQADLGLYCEAEERELDSVRLAFALASRRANLAAPVDGVTTALDDESRLIADVGRSRRLGFGAKLCIHPRQVERVNEALGPTRAQIAWANNVLEASRVRGTGAFRLDGQMIDAPLLQRARRLVDDDALCQPAAALRPLPEAATQP